MRWAAVGLGVVLAAAISVAAAAGSGPAATCTEQGSRVIVGLEGARETTLASGSDGRLLVDESPCGAATLAATKRIEVAAGAASPS